MVDYSDIYAKQVGKITPNSVAKTKFVAQKLGVSNETARRLMKKVSLKTGYTLFSIGEFLRHADRAIPNKETWFDAE